MSIVNARKQFEQSKRLTRLLHNRPRTVRQGFQIHSVFINGVFQLEGGNGRKLFDRAYLFSDVNYINQNDGEKREFLLSFMRFLNAMNVDFKIVAMNQFRSMEKFLKEIYPDGNREAYPEIAEGMRQWIQEKAAQGDNRDVEQLKYLVVTAQASDIEEAWNYFQGLEGQLLRLFQAFGSILVPLDAHARLLSLRSFFHNDQDWTPHSLHAAGRDVMNDVLPVSVESYKNFLMLGDTCCSVLMAREYESTLDEGRVLQGFSSLPYPSICTMDYAPVERSILKSFLAAAHMNVEKAISQEVDNKRKRGQSASGISYVRERQKEELEAYQDQIDENDESAFLVGLLVVVTAPTEEELARRVASVKHIGKENGVTMDIYNWVQLKALNTALPIGSRLVEHMRTFLSSSLVALQPFHAQDLQEPGGALYGLNRTTRHFVFADRKKLASPQGIILGHTGGGKSFLIKETEIAQVLLGTDDDIYAVDPQNELQGICGFCQGQFLDLTPASNLHINPLEIPEDVFKAKDVSVRNGFVAEQTGWAIAFCAAVMHNIVFTQEHHSAVGRCIRAVYDRAFTQKILKWQPTLKDVRQEIANQMEQAGHAEDEAILRRIFNSLEEYTEGSCDLFAHPSNVELKERLVVFGLRKVDQSLWEPVMLTIMHFLTNRMEYNRRLHRATRLIVDETQVVCNQKSSADLLLRAVVTFRKFGGIVTMAMQNLSRALENPELRDMFSNCGYKCFLDQGGVDAQVLGEIQALSEMEFASLSEDIPGYGVMVWGKKVILLDACMSNENILYQPFSTNFYEKGKEKPVKTEEELKPVPTVHGVQYQATSGK